jgi:hypothetical protein
LCGGVKIIVFVIFKGGVVITGLFQTTVVLESLNDIFQQNLMQMLPQLFGKSINISEEEELSSSNPREC